MDTKIIAIKQDYSFFTQQGFATLTAALMISFLATFMTLYAAKVGVVAQRIAANEFRAEQAFAAAEAGIEQGVAFLRINRKQINSEASGGWKYADSPLHWVLCNSSDTDLPCGDGISNLYGSDWSAIKNVENVEGIEYTVQPNKGSYFLHFLRNTNNGFVFFVVAEGKSADGSGQAFIKQGVYFYPLVVNIPDAPLMAGGQVSLGGNFSVAAAAHPDWRSAMPLSIWAKGDVTLSGSASTTDSSGADILDADTTFPADLFEYILGIPAEEAQAVKGEATLLASCDSLDSSSSGLYWIAGDCKVNGDGSIGSANASVLLVVKGNITVNGNRDIYGLIFSFPDSSDSSEPSSTVQINVELTGNAIIHGAVIANEDINQAKGSFEMHYDSQVLQNLRGNINSRGFALIPGSWADY